MEKSSMSEGGPGPNWTASGRTGATATYGCALAQVWLLYKEAHPDRLPHRGRQQAAFN